MNYQEFLIDVKSHIQATLGADTTLSVKNIAKNNGVRYEGLMIGRKDCNISPTIFLNPYYSRYQEGVELDEIYRDILRAYYSKLPQKSFDASFFLDFGKVRSHIVPKLINYAKNKELLEQVPHIPYLDLAVVFQCLVSATHNEEASILIRNEHMERWCTSPGELYQLSLRNAPLLLPCQFGNMMDYLRENGAIEPPEIEKEKELEPEMYLLTNQVRINGASTLLYPGILEQISSFLGKNMVIIPSSIHELLIIPIRSDDCNPENLAHFSVMVREVNRDHVVEDEILSDNAYLYIKADGQLREI